MGASKFEVDSKVKLVKKCYPGCMRYGVKCLIICDVRSAWWDPLHSHYHYKITPRGDCDVNVDEDALMAHLNKKEQHINNVKQSRA